MTVLDPFNFRAKHPVAHLVRVPYAHSARLTGRELPSPLKALMDVRKSLHLDGDFSGRDNPHEEVVEMSFSDEVAAKRFEAVVTAAAEGNGRAR
jgi:hypothetical protein